MRGRRVAVVALVVVAAIVAVVVVRGRLAGRNSTPRYRTAEVTRGDLLLSVSASGTVEPISLVDVRSRATGQVRTVLVDSGPTLVGVLLDGGLVQRLSLLVAPQLAVDPTVLLGKVRRPVRLQTLAARPLRNGYVHLEYRVAG